ncbi:MAG TPA: UDP-N-acetylmuramoyl-L-alanyl-D-glutamate--2,6-diaminopimelate ligase [Solirubrobacteraceae bacterium]|jgi:UDP-N-acetylmuramoyl-L-alanyl-D-glutamate--2,6-diaminopimelate ligase|nr:UDP-N-acetylmuramoyl-L-alanyl-D-glutamate--2,6-diaminopimelate ligase [Solirubrobacteraceae bacterium]
MRLDGLIAAASSPQGDLDFEAAGVEITGLAYDSREAAPGDLFFCVSGYRSDGHDFAAQAVRAGAAALVVERPLDLGVPEVVVASARAAMAPAAARFYGDPARELRVVAVTGTNGKTTTTYLLRALLEAAGEQCGLLGTVKSVIAGEDRQVARTTPEAIDLQEDLRAMLDGGDRACAMEVSSHALELGRVDAIGFAAAIFTNLTQDHLDFHASMEDYFQAKRRLFLPEPPAERPALSVINVADPYGRRLAREVQGALTFAVDAPADYSATDLRCGLDGCRFTLDTPAGRRELALPMPGRFNVANALGALAAAHALGAELDVLVAALERGVRVPGRLEPVQEGQEFAVLVDYAHTPDSLENVLRAARELADAGERGRVLCVFGAGGDRDRGKRPLMGEIAARLADVSIVTSDNPRSEHPERIIEEIMDGAAGSGGAVGAYAGAGEDGGARVAHVRALVDRRAAIEEAIAAARRGDVVVIAGKGHEQGQEFADGHKLPFDDVAVATAALRAATPAGAR